MSASAKAPGSQPAFRSFPPASIKFLAALAKNNNREWFQPHKQEFENVLHTPLVQFAHLVNATLEKNAREYALPDPAKALNRIYRDIRFSADKTPYQNHVSLLFPHQRLGKKMGAALYFHLSATEVMFAGGMYFGETRELQAVREHLANQHKQLRKILASKPLQATFGEMSGDSLQKVPKQFGADHPAADLLKQKQWLLMTSRPAKAALDDGFAAEALTAFKLLLPFVSFLNAPLESLPAKSLDPLL